MKANNLDALLFPGANGAAIAAEPGLSHGDRALRDGAECLAASRVS